MNARLRNLAIWIAAVLLIFLSYMLLQNLLAGVPVPWIVPLLVSWLPFFALLGVWIFLSRQVQKPKE